jgi:hypothetical protein
MSSFYEIINKRGGVLEASALSEHNKWMAERLRNLWAKIRDAHNSSSILYPLGKASFELVRNREVNAFAHYDNGVEGIAIYSGLFQGLVIRSGDLWSERGLLAHPRIGLRAHSDISHLLDTATFERWRKHCEAPLSPDHRIQRCYNTAITAISFVLMHEIGHLLQAHIPFLNRRSSTGVLTLFEQGNSALVATSQELQHIEVDADDHAMRTIMDLAMTTWRMGRIFPMNFDYPQGDLFAYLVDILRGPALVFFCMDESSVTKNLHSNGSHPVPGVRAANALVSAMPLLDHPFKVPREVAIAATLAAYIEVGDLFTALGLNAPTLEHDICELLRQAEEARRQAAAFLEHKQEAVDQRLRALGADPDHFRRLGAFYERPSEEDSKR